MAYSILSQDIMAICLLLAEGDLDLSLEEIVTRLEKFQKTEKRCFGTTDVDFRCTIYMLLFLELEINDPESVFHTITLRTVTPSILKFHEWYSNDEGEHWHTLKQYGEGEISKTDIASWYRYNENGYPKKEILLHNMRSYFNGNNIKIIDTDSTNKFITKNGITESIFYHCSR